MHIASMGLQRSEGLSNGRVVRNIDESVDESEDERRKEERGEVEEKKKTRVVDGTTVRP
jgi:hypothetical protein